MQPNRLIHLLTIVATIVLGLLSEAAPTISTDVKTLSATSGGQPLEQQQAVEPASVGAAISPATTKIKRDSKSKVTALELDTQETGYLPAAYSAADSDYGYDSGKNSYGKQASDWSLYDQGKLSRKERSVYLTGYCLSIH